MNKKFVIKGTNIPIKEGDRVTLGNLTKEDLEYLVKTGVLVADDELTLEAVINKLANKLDTKAENVISLLEDLSKVNPTIVFSLLLKETAIILDKKYEGHITESEELYIVSQVDGEVYALDGYYNSDTISLFRSKEDAELAVSILKPYWSKVWGE